MKELIENYHNLTPDKQKLVKLLLKEQGIDINSKIILPQKRDKNLFPMSFAQQRLWFLDQLEPGSPLYIIPSAVKISGNVNIDYLVTAINEIVKRHEVLRTRFIEKNGKGYQEVLDEVSIIPTEYNLTGETEYKAELEKILKTEFSKPFNLSEIPLLRIIVVKVSDELNYLLLPMHHIVSDNWSTGIFIKEIVAFYNHFAFGTELKLEPVKIQYLDFSVWQQEWMHGEELEKQKKYWVNQLKDSNYILEIVPDKKRPAVQSYNGSFKKFIIGKELLDRVKLLSRNEDVTIFMYLITVFQIVLYRISGQDDLNVGTPIANRNRLETENIIGFFINTLVIRGKLSGNPTFQELLQRNKKTTLDAYTHQDLPVEKLVEEMQLERDMSHTALFQAMFVLNNAPMTSLKLPGIELEPMDIDNGTSKFDMVLSMTEHDDGLHGKFEYNTDLFNSGTIENVIKYFNNIISEVSENTKLQIDNIQLLSRQEQEEIINHSIQNGKTKIIDGCLHSYFELQVEKYSDNIAIRFNEDKITYSELNSKANKLSNFLIKNGCKNGTFVGVYLDRSIEYIISLIAIIKAGGVYLPLDINYPDERLDYLLKDSNSEIIISKDEYLELFDNCSGKTISIDGEKSNIEKENTTLSNVEVNSADIAYIIYTSGSTGLPKGVLVNHSTILNHIVVAADHFEITANDKVLQFAAFIFDASIEQIFTALLSGAELILRGEDIWEPSNFHQYLNKYALTVINPPTVYWEQLVVEWTSNPEQIKGNNLRLVIAGGDVMKPEVLELWNNSDLRNIRLLNAYGPTETTITSSTLEILHNNHNNLFRVPVGKPLNGRRYYVVDKNGLLLPNGIPGELWIGGEGVSSGYLDRSELTVEKFIDDPFVEGNKSRIYKTGDLVRRLDDGNIEFLGRIDNQVKIRGFRIELGEIEHALKTNPEINDAIVIDTIDQTNNKQLTAYIIKNNDNNISWNLIREFISQKIPSYMIPANYMFVKKFPLTHSGKIDRNALPVPELFRADENTEFISPRYEDECIIQNVLQGILGIDKIGIYDNFFELGGHSMLATQVISRLKKHFDLDLSLRILFENPTIEGLAKAIAELQVEISESDYLINILNDIENISDEEVDELLKEYNKKYLSSKTNGVEDKKEVKLPQNVLEEFLSNQWKKVLNIDKISIYDNFFDLGGNVEKVRTLQTNLEKELNISIPPGALFQTQNLNDLAASIMEFYPDVAKQKFGIIHDYDDKYKIDFGSKDVGKVDEKMISDFAFLIKRESKTKHDKNIIEKLDKAVFVLSPPRSGSTLLRIMLAGNRNLFSPPEMDLLSFHSLNERESFFNLHGLKLWNEALIRVLMEIYNIGVDEANEVMTKYQSKDITTFEFFKIIQEQIGNKLIVDKTPSYSVDMNILEKAENDFDNPYYIHLVRNPYAMIYSFIEAKLDQYFFKYKHHFPRVNLGELIWYLSNRNISEFAVNIPNERICRIKFEDLLLSPKKELEKICSFLKIEFHDEMLNPYSGKKMTDGIQPDSQMVGDFKFYLRDKVDTNVKDRWKRFHKNDFLSDQSLSLAAKLGYEINELVSKKEH